MYMADIQNVIASKHGKSFGSKYTILGSVGLSDVPNVRLLSLDTNGARSIFSTCSTTDYAILQIPIDDFTIPGCTLDVRVSGLGTLFPNGASPTQSPFPIRITGVLVVIVPVYLTNIRWKHINLDLTLFCEALDALPSTVDPVETILRAAVPLQSMLEEYAQLLTKTIKKNILPKIHRDIQTLNAPLECDMPPRTIEVCTDQTIMPNNACSVCDTCCQCIVQQRCDGDCASCECITCGGSEWTLTAYISCACVLVFVIFVLYPRFKR